MIQYICYLSYEYKIKEKLIAACNLKVMEEKIKFSHILTPQLNAVHLAEFCKRDFFIPCKERNRETDSKVR